MAARRTNPDFLNGVPELLILRLLSQRARHGYDLVQALKLATGAALEFGEGCIYPVLHRLEAGGLLKCRECTVEGRSRRVYHITAAGQKRLAESIGAWTKVTQAVADVLRGTQYDNAQWA